jgi:hypothetical protein
MICLRLRCSRNGKGVPAPAGRLRDHEIIAVAPPRRPAHAISLLPATRLCVTASGRLVAACSTFVAIASPLPREAMVRRPPHDLRVFGWTVLLWIAVVAAIVALVVGSGWLGPD